MTTPNPNLSYAEILVDALARSGVQQVCLAPGSRSTPLALVCHAHPAIRVYRHLDERSAAFFALGLAQARGQPVALVCTSGTAAVEFHPAVVEAYHSQVPLLLLTADRPPELRDSGANQTIHQVKLYGDHVLWSVDVPTPEADPPPVLRRHLRTLAARAVAIATGLRPGPVHLNLPFRKPLEPTTPFRPDLRQPPPPQILPGRLQPTEATVQLLADRMASVERGWILCGPGCPGGEFPAAVAALAGHLGYPILADPLSGVRFGPHVGDAPILAGYESFLQASPAVEPPQVVIRFGRIPTSKWLNAYLDRVEPGMQVHVRASGVWADDTHRVTHLLQADETATCRALMAALPRRGPGAWARRWQALEEGTQAHHRTWLEGDWWDAQAVRRVVDGLPDGANLVLGNSLPVRHVDQFAPALSREIRVFGNRGASGIDGLVSTALGVAAADPARPTVLLIGDVSFYHDLNGLLAVRAHGLDNATMVVLHNDGGGIFRRLPIAAHEPPFRELFLAPHGLDFEPVARMYGLEFVRIHDGPSLDRALGRALEGPATVLQVVTDGTQDEQRRRRLVEALRGVEHLP